jgi:hypothetical protein
LLLYVGTIVLVTAIITGSFLVKAQGDGLSGWLLGLIGILSLLGASHLSIALVNWLATLYSQADQYFWATLVNQHTMTGTVNDDPFDAATKICAASEEAMESILTELNTICNQTGTLSVDSDKSLNLTVANNLITGMSQVTNTLQNLLNAPISEGIQNALSPALADIYTYAKGILETLGTLYPAVFTSFYPVLTGLQVQVDSDTDEVALTLTDGISAANWPAGSGWEQLQAGDLVQVVALNATGGTGTGAISDLINNVYAVASVTTNVLTLTVPGVTDVDFAGALTGLATIPGTEFVLRKIGSA